MCLAIFKPKGVTIKKKYLRNGWDANEDGAGFAIARNGAVEIHKGFFSWKAFYAAFSEFNKAGNAAIVHFRFATHGITDKANCHPFAVCGDKYGMIHNGVIDIECADKARSDTHHFAELVLAPILDAGVAFDSGALRYLVEEAIGSMNKIVLLRADGAHVIFNEKEGEWQKGCWYSNSGFRCSWSSFASAGKGCGALYGKYYSPYGAHKSSDEPKARPYETHKDGSYAHAKFYDESDWTAGSVSAEGYGSEWEYKLDHETNQWKRSAVQKRLAEMTEEEWRKECEEELRLVNAEENERFSG